MSAPKPHRFIKHVVNRMMCQEGDELAQIACDESLSDLRELIMKRYRRELMITAESEDAAQSDEE